MKKKIGFEVAGVRPELLQPVGIEFTKDGKYVFVALGPGNRVAVIDPKTYAVKDYILVGQRPWHLELSPDQKKLRLHDARTPILVFSMHSDPVIVSRALEVGATGYVLKDTSSDEVLKAFQRVRENRPYLSHDLASEVAFMEARGTTNPLRRMTVRELQTLALVAEGKPYGVIAEHLHVSYKTVANTCTQLKAKLGVRTLPELMRIAIQHLPSASAKTPRGEWS